jgi:hypothetical protein
MTCSQVHLGLCSSSPTFNVERDLMNKLHSSCVAGAWSQLQVCLEDPANTTKYYWLRCCALRGRDPRIGVVVEARCVFDLVRDGDDEHSYILTLMSKGSHGHTRFNFMSLGALAKTIVGGSYESCWIRHLAVRPWTDSYLSVA